MTYKPDTTPFQFLVMPPLTAPQGHSPRTAVLNLQRLLTLSTGGVLLSVVAETPVQSANVCPPATEQSLVECVDRAIADDVAQAGPTAVNGPQPDRALSSEAVPTFSTTAADNQPQATPAIHRPTVESSVAIAWSAAPIAETPIITAQNRVAPEPEATASVASAVENLQKSLNRAGFNVEVNGVFDQPTQTALQQFRMQRGLDVAGIAGSPEQTSLVSPMPAGYARSQSLLLVQNTDGEPAETAPSSDADSDDTDSEGDPTDTSPDAETEASDAADQETEATEADSAETPDSSEDTEATDSPSVDSSEDNSATEDRDTPTTDERESPATDGDQSEMPDADKSDVGDEDSTVDNADDASETTTPAAEEDTPTADTPTPRDRAPARMEPVDKSGTPEATPPSSPAPESKKPDQPGGSLNNTATGTSRETPPQGASADVPVASHPVFGFNKTVTEVINPDGSIDAEKVVDEAGDTIKYTMRVSNLGNVTLTGVAIADPLLKADPAADVTLNVGDDLFFQGEYTATQADLDGEPAYIHNEATFSSHQTSPKTDGEAVPLRKIPALTVEKQAVNIDRKNDGQLNAVGDIIDYEIVVTNTGNQTLTNVEVNDSLIGDRRVNQLAPNQSKTFVGQYTLTQPDIDTNGGGDGDIDNTVIVKADQVAPAEDFVEVELQQSPALVIEKRVLEVDKEGDGVLNKAGDKIHYEVIVRNTGNQTLNNVIVTDPLLGGTIDEGFSLSPGGSKSYQLTYTVTQADLDNGGVPLNAPEFLNPSQP